MKTVYKYIDRLICYLTYSVQFLVISKTGGHSAIFYSEIDCNFLSISLKYCGMPSLSVIFLYVIYKFKIFYISRIISAKHIFTVQQVYSTSFCNKTSFIRMSTNKKINFSIEIQIVAFQSVFDRNELNCLKQVYKSSSKHVYWAFRLIQNADLTTSF